MDHLMMVKCCYALYSPFQYLKLRIKGIDVGRYFLSCGSIYVSKFSGSTIRIGNNCRFMSKSWGNLIGLYHRCILSTGTRCAELVIGDGCSFSGVSIRCFQQVVIRNNVRVGANVLIVDGDAHQNDPRSNDNRPILIEDNVWIGTSVIVLKGVTIGKNSVIGAGSIVTKDIPANVVAAGNPCRVIKTLNEDIINKLEQ